jgi:hypothetical protein
MAATWNAMADVLEEIKAALDDLEYLLVVGKVDSDCGLPTLIVRGHDGDHYKVTARPVHNG